MINYQQTTFIIDENFVNQIYDEGMFKSVGKFVIEDVLYLNERDQLNIKNINFVAIEDWSLSGLYDIDRFISENKLTIDIVILNLNEVDAVETEENDIILSKINDIMLGQGYFDITKHIGYETRLAFIYSKKEIGSKIVDAFSKGVDQ